MIKFKLLVNAIVLLLVISISFKGTEIIQVAEAGRISNISTSDLKPSTGESGGGYVGGGLKGEYFSNKNFKGKPIIERNDIRLDFDWRTKGSVSGSISNPYKLFPRNNFFNPLDRYSNS